MIKKVLIATGITLVMSAGHVMAATQESATVSCADLNWSVAVLAANPDVGKACQGVYESNGKLYAKATIEIVRIRGNDLTYQPLHTDGSKGDSRNVVLESNFRAKIAGRDYRLGQLQRGQELTVYLPEDRFSLIVEDVDAGAGADAIDESNVMAISAATAMPTTASPLYLFGLAGGAFLMLGGLMSGIRRRQA